MVAFTSSNRRHQLEYQTGAAYIVANNRFGNLFAPS